MLREEKWHRHVGVYGVCFRPKNRDILVIKKAIGPYQGRYDLPGGSMEPNESLGQALIREFHEEAGLLVTITGCMGIFDFLIPYPFKESTHTHHIALLFQVQIQNRTEAVVSPTSGTVQNGRANDAASALWVNISRLEKNTCSPVLTKAVDILSGQETSYDFARFSTWKVLS